MPDFDERWLQPGGLVPIDWNTVSALIAEVLRIRGVQSVGTRDETIEECARIVERTERCPFSADQLHGLAADIRTFKSDTIPAATELSGSCTLDKYKSTSDSPRTDSFDAKVGPTVSSDGRVGQWRDFARKLERKLSNTEWIMKEQRSLNGGLAAECDMKQAQIDRLMLEYCSEEMTPKQLEEWRRSASTAATEKTHSDHPLRHFDRTCPACIAEGVPSDVYDLMSALCREKGCQLVMDAPDLERVEDVQGELPATAPSAITHNEIAAPQVPAKATSGVGAAEADSASGNGPGRVESAASVQVPIASPAVAASPPTSACKDSPIEAAEAMRIMDLCIGALARDRVIKRDEYPAVVETVKKAFKFFAPLPSEKASSATERKEFDPEARRVVCAALRNGEGTIVCGPRHFDETMRRQIIESGGDWRAAEQGFVDQRGEWLTREEALSVAVVAGQIIRRCGGDDHELFSENLY